MSASYGSHSCFPERDSKHRCSNLSLLSVSDYLFWQQFQERGRTKADIHLLSVSLGSTGTDGLNTKNAQKGIFKVLKRGEDALVLPILSRNLVFRMKSFIIKTEIIWGKKMTLHTIENTSLIELCVCIYAYIYVQGNSSAYIKYLYPMHFLERFVPSYCRLNVIVWIWFWIVGPYLSLV